MKLLFLTLCIGSCMAGPVLYKLNSEDNEAEAIKIPVASTVIPLDDLPELNVGFGFGLVDRTQVKKPTYLKNIKLITSKNKHRFLAPAGVTKLSKADFEDFANKAF